MNLSPRELRPGDVLLTPKGARTISLVRPIGRSRTSVHFTVPGSRALFKDPETVRLITTHSSGARVFDMRSP